MRQLEELLLELDDAFALDDSELGETDLIITLTQGRPDQNRLHHEGCRTLCVRN